MSATPTLAERAERSWQLLGAGDAAGAWAQLTPLSEQLGSDPELAALWLDLLRADPTRDSLVAEVTRVLARWPDDAGLVTRACDALIRAAERVAPDLAQPAESPAALAASAAEQCLQRCSDAALKPFLLMAGGNALRLLGKLDEAQQAMERALAAVPERAGFWFNLGLLHKARRSWREALDANQRALALAGNDKAALWNSAICATALGEGAIAVNALRALGHDAKQAPSGMPYVEGLPLLQVRAATVGSGLGTASALPDRSVGFELFWVTPISPCHGVVSSASYRDASIDYGDVVLWDAVPVGIAEHEGKPVPRMPLLAVLLAGDERRFRFVALQQAPGQVAAIAPELPGDAKLFVHQERIELLCARCASGEHMHKHQHEAPQEHRLVYGKIVVPGATSLPEFRKQLEQLLLRHAGVRMVLPGLYEAIGDSEAAGKAHQLWRGLERSGQRPTARS
jgi:tetratricopeptide (TPR) repeat protein